jgi:hypothetical protein
LNTRIARVGRSGAPEPIETGEIHSVAGVEAAPKSRLLLSESEAALSLPPSTELPNAVAPLTQILGRRLTVDSPAWSGDPVPGMRMLQRSLVATSLELPDGERADLMSAIELVEKAVQMRLRWQQMRRSEAEGPIELESEEKACVPS